MATDGFPPPPMHFRSPVCQLGCSPGTIPVRSSDSVGGPDGCAPTAGSGRRSAVIWLAWIPEWPVKSSARW